MKTILAAVDTSSSSRSVFKEALVLASTIRAEVVAVSVTPEYEGNMNRFCLDDAQRELSEPFLKILNDAKEYAGSLGLNMKAIHRTGKPGNEIVKVARECNASLIMLGCSKKHQVERMLLGRIMVEIIMESPCDVMLIPEGAEVLFGNILVSVSGTEQGIAAEQRALEVAASYGSKLHGLFSLDVPTERSFRYGVMQEAEQKASKVLKDFVNRGKEGDVQVVSDMMWNTPDRCLVDYARENGIQLIVIETPKDAGMLKMIGGSMVERIASNANCPILIVYRADDKESKVAQNFL